MTSPQRRIGVMGGTFDPIHFAHLLLASEAAHAFVLDLVLFVPTGDPWQKADRDVTDAQLRCDMVQAAIAGDERFELSRVDVERVGATYAVDTMRDLHALYTGAEFFFITGADAFTGLPGWKDVAELLQLTQFIGAARPGHVLDESGLAAAGLDVGRLHTLDIPQLEISSTALRARVAAGQPVNYLLPEQVRKLIDRHRLYRP